MSFILDALKKSESDRQRQSGPALYEVKVAAPRSQLPYWAIGLIVLLGINLVIVAWALLRRPSHEPEGQTAAASAQPAPAPPPPAAIAYAPVAAAPGAASQPAGGLTSRPTGGPTSQSAGAQANSTVEAPPATFIAAGQPPAQGTVSPGENPTASSDLPPEEDSTRSATASRASAGASGEAAGNPDDYAPATEPSKRASLGFHVTRGTAEGVPLYSQVASGAGIPELRLDLHAYDTNPDKRFVLINMKKEREGDMLPDGATKVDTITPDGVVLDHEGTKFLLPRP